MAESADALIDQWYYLEGQETRGPVPSAEIVKLIRGGSLSATALASDPGGTLTASVQVSTSGQPSDELDAATAADGAPVAVYHQQVNVGELPDLSGCGVETPSPAVVDNWLHYGPLLIPGRSGGASSPATATLTVQLGSGLPPGTSQAITFYFAHAGSVTLRLPVSRA